MDRAGTRCLDEWHRVHHRLRGQATEAPPQFEGIVQQSDRQLALKQHRPGVQAFLHGHHTDTGLDVTTED